MSNTLQIAVEQHPASTYPSVGLGAGAGTTDASTAQERCVVLGIGNPLMGDDGVGVHVLNAMIKGTYKLPETAQPIELVEGGTLGYLLVDRLAEIDSLIVVDATNLQAEAGQVQVFVNEQMDEFLGANASFSVHEVGLIDLVQMMLLMGKTPRRRALVGIQPQLIDWETELSPPVAASLANASSAISALLLSWYGVKPQ